MFCKLRLTTVVLGALSLGFALLSAAPASAQIPPGAVDAALNGPTTTMMLTATSGHTYRHRIRIEKINVKRSGDTVVAAGKLVNVIKFDTDGVMHFQVTCRAGQVPDIQILSVKEPKKAGRTLKTVGRFAAKVLPIVVAAVSSGSSGGEASGASTGGASAATQSFDLQTVADGVGSGAEVRQLNERDWKVPATALIGAIAARLQSTL